MWEYNIERVIQMALRKILTDKDDTLHKVCRPVEKFDERLATLLDDMHETLDKAQGLGLAAPQVGICRRIFIMHLEEGSFEVINPEVSKREGKQRVQEGCLSCPDVWGYVTRPMSVHLKAQDRNGNWFSQDSAHSAYVMKMTTLTVMCLLKL